MEDPTKDPTPQEAGMGEPAPAAQEGGKKGKKKKKEKMSLAEFQGGSAGGSWADEVEDEPSRGAHSCSPLPD